MVVCTFTNSANFTSANWRVKVPMYLFIFGVLLLVLLRYGWRVPAWAWIKFGLSIAILSISIFALTPASDAATQWARWSAEHGQLAPQFLDNIARTGPYGATILVLLLVTTIVAIWKPFSGGIAARRARVEAAEAA